MGRVGKVNRRERERIQMKSKGSDESDEDYTVGEDNQDESEDYHASHGDVSDETFDSFGEEGEVVGKFVRPKTQKGSSTRRKNGVKKPNKKRDLYEDDDEEYEEDDDEEYEDEVIGKFVRTKTQKGPSARRKGGVKKSNKKRALYEDDDEEYEEDDEEYEEDEEVIGKFVRPKTQKGSSGRRKGEVKKSNKKKALYEDDDEEYEEDDDEYEEDEEVIGKFVRPKTRKGSSGRRKGEVKNSNKNKALYEDDDEEYEEDDEEYEEDEEVIEKFVRPKTQKGSSGRRKGEVKNSNKKRALYEDDDEEYEEDDDEEYDDEEEEEEEEEEEDCFDDEDSEDYHEGEESTSMVKKSRKRKKSYKEDEEEEDYDFDVDDEEFTPNEIDCLDEEEELPKKKRVRSKPSSRKKGPVRGQKRKKKSNVPKKPLQKKRKRNRGSRKKGVSRKYGEVVEQKNGRRRLKRSNVQSDSDFVTPGPSDFEFTLSEEERQQVREASEICGSLEGSLRSSKMPKRSESNGSLNKEKKNRGKGKEKVDEFKDEIAGKPVCGICFSEEGKKVVRGILDCCSHYFCFSCIMEWSKVESRCPLCKQRFKTITKPTKPDSKDVVIQVPKRNQVYQPSEEEVRGYLDPYENVICTECQQGGDDGLMLLCDLCDSPAHTYCVGLGHEVPEGNWYCEGCRPSLGSADSQTHTQAQAQAQTQTDSILDQTPARNNSSNRLSLDLDLNSAYVPDTPVSNGTPSILSPRYHSRDFEATSPVSTVSGRRRIHRHIQNFLSSSRMSQTGGRPNGVSISSPRSDYLDPFQGRAREDNPSTSGTYRDLFSRLSHLRRHVVQDYTTTRTDGSDRGSLRNGLLETNLGGNAISVYESVHQNNRRLSIGSDASGSPGGFLNVEKEQLQSMVKRHLESLSSVDLGRDMFKDIARSSTHTILAACGLEHRRSEVIPVQPPLMYRCLHPQTIGSIQMSLMQGLCASCFDLFVKDVVKRIMTLKLQPQFSFHN